MTLPVYPAAISLNAINVELGLASTTQASLGQASYRTLAGVASGAISMSNFHGKANQFAFTISSNQANANLATLATAAGWNGSSKVVATISSGVYIYSTSTGTPALTIPSSLVGGAEIINNGYIMGMGGTGGGIASNAGIAGAVGGPAISLGVSCSITNNSYIGGGGGGGSGSQSGGGGGAGGGAGGSTNPAGGAGGGPGASGNGGTGAGNPGVVLRFGGGGGGRIMPGVGGDSNGEGGSVGGGAGGGGGIFIFEYSQYGGVGNGGSGGGVGGPAGQSGSATGGGGGGGWGASGGNAGNNLLAGAAGGKAIALNGYTATRTGSGTTYGAVS